MKTLMALKGGHKEGLNFGKELHLLEPKANSSSQDIFSVAGSSCLCLYSILCFGMPIV